MSKLTAVLRIIARSGPITDEQNDANLDALASLATRKPRKPRKRSPGQIALDALPEGDRLARVAFGEAWSQAED